MQDQYSAGSTPSTNPAPANEADVQLTPLDQAAIDATSTLGEEEPARSVPGRGHKMEILDETIAALDKQTGEESPLVQLLKGWIDKAAAIAHVAVDKTASTVVPLAQAAADAKVGAVAKAKDYKDSAAVAKDQWVDDAKSAIRERPLTALGIAVLTGVAMTLIFSSKSDAESED